MNFIARTEKLNLRIVRMYSKGLGMSQTNARDATFTATFIQFVLSLFVAFVAQNNRTSPRDFLLRWQFPVCWSMNSMIVRSPVDHSNCLLASDIFGGGHDFLPGRQCPLQISRWIGQKKMHCDTIGNQALGRHKLKVYWTVLMVKLKCTEVFHS